MAQDNCPGYFTNFTTLPNNNTFSFSQHYAVLNLDLVVSVVAGIADTSAGQQFISSVSTWIDAVHAQNPPPLTIFSRAYFANYKYPEVKPGSAFASMLQAAGFDNSNANTTNSLTNSSPYTQIYPAFNVSSELDIVMKKTTYGAGYGNELDIILNAQSIDTVILSGIRTSGVILASAISLFERNYNVFVISNNSIETAPLGLEVDRAMREGVLPKLPAQVITLEQALGTLNRSGPAVY